MGNFARGEAGFFISMIEFTKVPKEPKELVELLRQRGLVVRDAQRAERYLSTIGYYRLSGYFAPFECEKDTFCHEVEFQDVLNLYIFDRKLRLHIMDAIERIEIAIRSVLSHVLCMRYGSHWYLNKDNKVFKDTFNHQILIKTLNCIPVRQVGLTEILLVVIITKCIMNRLHRQHGWLLRFCLSEHGRRYLNI